MHTYVPSWCSAELRDPRKPPHKAEPRAGATSPAPCLARPARSAGTWLPTRFISCEWLLHYQISGLFLHPPGPPDTPCTTPVTSCKQQHKPSFNPPICLFSVFIKEVENERKRLGEGDGMTKSVTCLFNFSAPPTPPPPYIPWGHGLQSELQIFTNSINRIQIVFRGASTTQTRVSPLLITDPQRTPPAACAATWTP